MIRIGRVTTRRGARIHLAIDGRTADGYRAATIRPVVHHDLVEPGALCRRCWTPARIARAEAALVTATGPEAARNRRLLARVSDGMKTPEQLAAEQDLIARINATIDAAAPVLALPIDERAASWADLRADYLTTHAQPVAA
jgi:hypothetical protein